MNIYRSAIAIAILTLTFLPLSLSAAASEPSADALYQEAVFQETTARDLIKAIVLYKKTLEQPGINRNLQSNVYLRLGICYRTLGQNDQAKDVWNKLAQDFADQPATYQEAKTHLQELAAEEGRTTQVQSSTPAVVYAIPKTRWELRLPGIGYSSNSGEGVFVLYPSLAYFYKTNRAVVFEGSVLPSENRFKPNGRTLTLFGGEYPDGSAVTINTTYLAVTHQWEKPLGNQLHPYFKLGPAIYRFNAFDNFTETTNGVTTGGEDVTKWSPGLLAEAGVTIGWSRGFVFTLGYGVNTFYQPSLLGVVGNSIREVHAARFALGYRW